MSLKQYIPAFAVAYERAMVGVTRVAACEVKTSYSVHT